jgi:membrane protease YdiL (CAAX protease family)
MLTRPDSPNRSHLEVAALVLFVLPFINGIYNKALVDQPRLFWALDVIQFIVLPLCVAVLLFTRSGLRAADVGLGLPQDKIGWKVLILHSLVIGILFYPVCKGFDVLFLRLFPASKSPPMFDYGWMMPKSGGGQWLVGIYYAIGGGLTEEFYYRGLLVALFTQYKMSNPIIVLCVSSMFALVHWEGGPSNILTTFFLSIF